MSNNDLVEIKPADKLYGKTTTEKEEIIKKEQRDSKYSTMTIEPAVENLVLITNAMSEERAAGRAGAVLCSKI